MSDDLIQRVRKVIATSKRIPLETVTIDSEFEQLTIDSMDAVEILFALENTDPDKPILMTLPEILNDIRRRISSGCFPAPCGPFPQGSAGVAIRTAPRPCRRR